MTPAATLGYDEHDVQRYFPDQEYAERDGLAGGRRSPFARDRARVLHSAALRRLGAITQCLDLNEGTVARVRLTHSLEVAHISREIGDALGADPSLMETAGLVHDLGHPPFGHNGESALDAIAHECGGFEANAQTLRILSRLEPGTHGAAGLNLTRASLDATCKYPWTRRPGLRKFGVYDDDTTIHAWIRHGAPLQRPCLEAQVMDWADDVAAAVSDLEDGIRSRLIRPAVMADRQERAALALLATQCMTSQPVADIEAAATELTRLPPMIALVKHGYDGTSNTQAAVTHLAGHLIDRYTRAAVSETRRAHGDGRLTRYRANLAVPGWARAEIAWLKALTLHLILRQQARIQRSRQRHLLAELFDALHHRAPETLDPGLRQAWTTACSNAARVRVIVDHVASLTEPQAIEQHKRLTPRHRDRTGASP